MICILPATALLIPAWKRFFLASLEIHSLLLMTPVIPPPLYMYFLERKPHYFHLLWICRFVVQQIHNESTTCCGFVVQQLVTNTIGTATHCVDHKSDNMSRCCGFVVGLQLSFCCICRVFVVQLVAQQIHNKFTTNQSNGVCTLHSFYSEKFL